MIGSKRILIGAAALALGGMWASPDSSADPAREILALERQGMDGWISGNPDRVLAAFDPEITYFHAVTDKRLDGLAAVKALFEGYRGRPLFDSYEIAGPKVRASGDMAVLTYQLVSHAGGSSSRWNATQVYQKKTVGWRVIHTHFSMVRPQP